MPNVEVTGVEVEEFLHAGDSLVVFVVLDGQLTVVIFGDA